MKYEVGDKVVVRDWEDMKNEYGNSPLGGINVGEHCTFTREMKKYCGKVGKIEELSDEDDDDYDYKISFDGIWSPFFFLDGMLKEPSKSDKDKEMKTMEYKVGDTVKIRKWSDMDKEYGTTACGYIVTPSGINFVIGMRKFCGQTGKICNHDSSDNTFNLEFDGKRYDFWFSDDMFEKPIKDKKSKTAFVVFVDGKTVIAKDVQNGITASAKCSENDEFDLYIGTIIAMNRLMAKKFDKSH